MSVEISTGQPYQLFQEYQEQLKKKSRLLPTRDERILIAKHCREINFELKRLKNIDNLSKWSNFRERRDAVFIKYCKAKSLYKRSSKFVKHAKVFLTIQKVYRTFREEQIRRANLLRKVTALLRIVGRFRKFLRQRFTTLDPNMRIIKRTRWCMAVFAAANVNRY